MGLASLRDGPAEVNEVRISLFTTCKPFEGTAAIHQRRALESWARLDSGCEVLVVGAEPGVREVCAELGLHHEPAVERSTRGTPRLDDLFRVAEAKARGEILCYANADILLASNVAAALRRVHAAFPRSLAIARRWNVDPSAVRALSPHSSDASLHEIARSGQLEPIHGGVDLFAFPRGFWRDGLPPYLIGRSRWDSALILEARRRRAPVIDITPCATTVHPIHDYAAPDGKKSGLSADEIAHNQRLLGGIECAYSALNATHVLHTDGLRRNRPAGLAATARWLATLPALHPGLRPVVPLVRWLAPRMRGLQPASGAGETPWVQP